MTHFAVAVIAEDWQAADDLLAPYMENCCDTPDYRYMEFHGCDQCEWGGGDCEDCETDEITGKRGYWQNPNAKWDWWVEGGRWEKWAKDFIGGTSVKISDIDYPAETERAKALEWYDQNVSDGHAKDVFGWTWGWCDGMTREQFADVRSRLIFRCVVTPDGEWHECGDTGWWGYYGESVGDALKWAEEFGGRFLEPYRDCTLTVIDCHI